MKQELTPILLPTDKTSHLYKYEPDNDSLKYKETPQEVTENCNPHHLYLLDDSKIEEGDWIIINNTVKRVLDINNDKTSVECNNGLAYQYKDCKKIIATTDKSLTAKFGNDGEFYGKMREGLPQIPQDFIKYFVEKQGNVGKVMVEYAEIDTNPYSLTWEEDYVKYGIKHKENLIKRPKLTKDNEVIISLENIPSGQDLLKMSKQAAFDAGIAYQKSLEKKTYTRDEIKKAFLAGCDPEIRDFDKWIEQNL